MVCSVLYHLVHMQFVEELDADKLSLVKVPGNRRVRPIETPLWDEYEYEKYEKKKYTQAPKVDVAIKGMFEMNQLDLVFKKDIQW